MQKQLKLGYCGSPDFSAQLLEKLLTDNKIKDLIKINFVLTQKDKPKGRKQKLTKTPVKEVAEKFNLPVIDDLEILKKNPQLLKVNDFILVFAYGKIIPKEFLFLPKYGFFNIHPSLLPSYRGVSPIAAAILADEKETGVTIFKMDEKLDHGPIIAQKKYKIKPSETRKDLEKNLSDLAFKMIKKMILTDTFDKIKPITQDESKASYTKRLTKKDGFIAFDQFIRSLSSSKEMKKIYCLYRAFYPWPGIWTLLPNNKRLKIVAMGLENNNPHIKKVQLEGKKEVDFTVFCQTTAFFPH